MSRLLVVAFAVLSLFPSHIFAQNRVVVIPLESDSANSESLIHLLPGKGDGIGRLICSGTEDCQDVFEFTLSEPATAQLRVFSVEGSSVIRVAIHAPGIELGGVNILTNSTDDLQCVGQDEELVFFPVRLLVKGTYKLAITRDFLGSAGSTGFYEATLFTSKPASFGGQIVDDVDSLATGGDCE